MEREKPPPLVVDYIDLASFEPQTRRQPESALALLPRFIEWVDKHGGRFIPLRKRSLHPTHKNFAHHGLLSVGEVLARDIEKDGNIGLVPWTRILVIDIDSPEAMRRVREVLDPRYVVGVLNGGGGGLHLVLLVPEGVEPLPQADGLTPMGRRSILAA